MPLRNLLSLPHWKSRLLLWGAAAAVGVAAVLFAGLADAAQNALRRLLEQSRWWPWLLAPLGFFVIAWVTQRYFRGAEGSGIPQTIFALRPDAGERAEAFLKPKVVIGRVLLAALGLLCGGSIGREGPTVHVGAVIVHSVARWMPHGRIEAQRRALVLAGGAAGVAAAFNTPLAGIVFAIEELSRSFEERASGTTLTAVILASIVAIALVGDYSYFGQPIVPSQLRALSPATIALAAVSPAASSAGLPSRARNGCRACSGDCAASARPCLPDCAAWRSLPSVRLAAISPTVPAMPRRVPSLKVRLTYLGSTPPREQPRRGSPT
jgi:H+/Cl- antiporter ClcA